MICFKTKMGNCGMIWTSGFWQRLDCNPNTFSTCNDFFTVCLWLPTLQQNSLSLNQPVISASVGVSPHHPISENSGTDCENAGPQGISLVWTVSVRAVRLNTEGTRFGLLCPIQWHLCTMFQVFQSCVTGLFGKAPAQPLAVAYL